MEGDALIARTYPQEVVERLGDAAMRTVVEEIRRRCLIEGTKNETDPTLVSMKEVDKSGVEE